MQLQEKKKKGKKTQSVIIMQTFRILLEQVICLIEFVIEDAAGMESDGMAPFDIRCALLLLSWIVHFFFFLMMARDSASWICHENPISSKM